MENKNKGFKYEDKIIEILKKKKLIPQNTKRTGGSDKADLVIYYKGNKIIVELKNKDTGADYGQKELLWSQKKLWHWSKDKDKKVDPIFKLFEGLKIIENQIPKNFVPERYFKKKHKNKKIKSVYEDVTVEDYNYDLKHMEKPHIPIPLNTLFKYYMEKNCFYIQIEKSGFYHLKNDKFNLGTKQFNGEISLRLRVKYRGSRKNINIKPWDYGFLAKIALKRKPTPSQYDLEELDGREFPFKQTKN